MRKKISSELKAKVALEALKGLKTVNEIASIYEVHPNQVINWKKRFCDGALSLFSKSTELKEKGTEDEINNLYRKIGQLEVENEFLKKKWQHLKSK